MFTNKVLVKVVGKNIERFIKRLVTNKIELLKIKRTKYNECFILVYKNDYEKVIELKTIYDVTEEEIYGIIRVWQVINLYKIIIISGIIVTFIFILLSNIIFTVEVIHSDSEIRMIIKDELEKYGIQKYGFKKKYNDLQIIKTNILEKYKNKIEWLEIVEDGTTYIIRVEERIILEKPDELQLQNVVSEKDALLLKIESISGQVIKEVNSFVKENEVIISSDITLNDEIKNRVPANGKIYGEVWYTITVNYPFIYNELMETTNYSNVYTLQIFNKTYELNGKFENKKIDNKVIYNHLFLPISFNFQKQKEVIIIDEELTYEEAYNKGHEKAIKQMEESLNDDEYILESKVIKSSSDLNSVELIVFFSVFENITKYEIVEVINDLP